MGLVAALTLLGLALRLPHLETTLLGDELSTSYIIQDKGFFDVLRAVSSDAEISPPLYFVAAWVFTQVSGDPEMVRLPALIAGTATIPLTYLVGRMALGNTAGLIAAAVMAINPFMIFYATDGRAYTLAIALLLTSTVAMLIAVRRRRPGWWALYGAVTALCMYTHYTTAFVLVAQLAWLLWAHPGMRRPAIVANLGAVLAFLPWIPSVLEDFRSPTIDILSDLQGDGFDVKLEAVGNWAFGYPYNAVERVPGDFAVTLGVAALFAAVAVACWRRLRARRESRGLKALNVSPGFVLVISLFMATPVVELLLLGVGGSDLFGARNLNTASGGFALTIGALLAAAGPLAGPACAAALLAVFGIGAVKSQETDVSTIDFRSAAKLITARASSDDVLLDSLSPVLTPVPLTPLDVHLTKPLVEYRLYLPEGPPPFLTFPPEPRPIVKRAIRAARGRTMFLVGGETSLEANQRRLRIVVRSSDPAKPGLRGASLPPGSKLIEKTAFPGLGTVFVYEIAVADVGSD